MASRPKKSRGYVPPPIDRNVRELWNRYLPMVDDPDGYGQHEMASAIATLRGHLIASDMLRAATLLALRNVMRLAMQRKRRGFKVGDADHLLRFCADAGVVPSVLRAPPETTGGE
jgi:hypothetical protein